MKRDIAAKSSFLFLFFFGGVCPLCIPKIAIIASFLGLTFIPKDSLIMAILFHAVFLAVIYMSLCSYHKHKNIIPFLCTALASTFFILYYYTHPTIFIIPNWTLYISLVVIALASVLDILCHKKQSVCTQSCCT